MGSVPKQFYLEEVPEKNLVIIRANFPLFTEQEWNTAGQVDIYHFPPEIWKSSFESRVLAILTRNRPGAKATMPIVVQLSSIPGISAVKTGEGDDYNPYTVWVWLYPSFYRLNLVTIRTDIAASIIEMFDAEYCP